MTSKVQIISDAFVNLGKQPVNSPLTDNLSYVAAAGIYDRILPIVLMKHPWRFSLKTFELATLTDTIPFDRWSYVYQLPADLLLIYRTDPLINYEIYGEKLYANVNELTLEYQYEPSESLFPYHFSELMTLELTARIAMMVTQLADLAKMWKQEAEKSLLLARALDSGMMPTQPVVRDSLVRAHSGSYISYINGVL